MSTQIEHLENHSARLTVEVAADRVEKAMHEAARRISRQVNIPGFRKGKAPYNVILQRFGAGAVLEEALEQLGNEVYREVLAETKLEPYAPGNLENVETEPQMKLTFVVSKQPEVDLANYRDIRLPFEVPEVEDSVVTETMKAMQDREALVETVTRPAQMTDLVKVHVKGDQVHPADEHQHQAESKADEQPEPASEKTEEPVQEKAEGETPEASAQQADDKPAEASAEAAGETFTTPYIDNDIDAILTEDEEEDHVLPGFSAHIVGLSAGDKKSITLAYPEGYKIEGLARHAFNLEVEVKEVQSRTVPPLNDDFAKRVTDNEVDNLLDLRVKVRQNLQDAQKQETESKYGDEILDKVIEQATIKYPEEMVDEYTDDILESLDRNLRERGLSIDHYKRIENKDDAALRADYRDVAIKRLKRALVLGEVINHENLTVNDADIDSQIDTMSQRFGEQAQVFRQMLNRAENKRSIAMELITTRAVQRLVAIGRGENPPIEPVPAESPETQTLPEESAEGQPAAEAQTSAESATSPATEGAVIETTPEASAETPAATPAEMPVEPASETPTDQAE